MNRENEIILDVQNLKKYFPIRGGLITRTVGHVKAVDGISFKLRRGETLGIVGESGCGKSTAGRTILRLHDITDGKVIFKGEDLAKCSKKGNACKTSADADGISGSIRFVESAYDSRKHHRGGSA